MGQAKDFAHAMVLAMEADSPDKYVSKMTKSIRGGKIFLDYLRNGRGATAIVAYSTRARPGAAVSTPVTWDELGPKLTPNKFTVLNIGKRLGALKRDPWADIAKVKQRLPDFGRPRKKALAACRIGPVLRQRNELDLVARHAWKRPCFHSFFACSIRSLREETKFHQT